MAPASGPPPSQLPLSIRAMRLLRRLKNEMLRLICYRSFIHPAPPHRDGAPGTAAVRA